jgi:hypothetical protein
MKKCLRYLQVFLLIGSAMAADDGIVVIGHGSMAKADLPTLQRLYTGRVTSINQQDAIPINLPAGNPWRQQFLKMVLGQSEEQYTGYWLVRRYVGKGVPPQELATSEEMLKYVFSTPGAVGYLPASKVPPGGNIIFRH